MDIMQLLNGQGGGTGGTLGTMAGMNAASSPYGRPGMGMEDPTGMNAKASQDNMLANQQKAAQNSSDISSMLGGGGSGDSGSSLSGLSSILSLFL
jgi:hypothetical protein